MSDYNKEQNKTARILIKKARTLEQRKNRIFYFNAAILSVYGWQLSVPVLLGVMIGTYCDKHFPSGTISWTLNGIFLGFIIGIFNANYWLRKEGITKRKDKK